jgi:dolichol-phosphate mannosyltransferase
MTSNFTLNNFITFNEKSLLGTNYFRGLISFYIVCSVGALLNVAVADFLFSNLGIWVIASLIGALLGALWNFMFSSIFTWRIR